MTNLGKTYKSKGVPKSFHGLLIKNFAESGERGRKIPADSAITINQLRSAIKVQGLEDSIAAIEHNGKLFLVNKRR